MQQKIRVEIGLGVIAHVANEQDRRLGGCFLQGSSRIQILYELGDSSLKILRVDFFEVYEALFAASLNVARVIAATDGSPAGGQEQDCDKGLSS